MTSPCAIEPIGNFSTENNKEIAVRQLVSTAKRGNQAAFAELYECHAKKIMGTTLRITRNREDAEDAVQDALMSAFVNLHKFDGRSSFATWLTRIAINSALMILRKKRIHPELSLVDTDDSGKERSGYQFRDYAPNPEEGYRELERATILRHALSKLRPRIRRAIELRQLQECSMKETAQILGISVAAAKGRLFHARAALRKASHLRAVGQAGVRRAA